MKIVNKTLCCVNLTILLVKTWQLTSFYKQKHTFIMFILFKFRFYSVFNKSKLKSVSFYATPLYDSNI